MLKGWKTVIFNVLMTAIGIISVFNPEANLPDSETLTSIIGDLDAVVVAVWGVGNVLIRAVTSTPIFKK